MDMSQWKDFLKVGHSVIDRQHLELFAIVKELGDGIRQSSRVPDVMLVDTIASLYDYASTCFEAEEQLMFDVGYPDLQRHRQAHELLINRLEGLEDKLNFSEEKMATQILSFLMCEWLGNHIVVEDQRFAHYAESHHAQVQLTRPAAAKYPVSSSHHPVARLDIARQPTISTCP